MSAAQHKAVALMPWQMRLQRPRWLLHQIGAAAALLLLAALISLVWAPYPPAEIDIPNKLQPPTA